MKSLIISLSAICILAVIVVGYIYYSVRPMLYGDRVAAFAPRMAEFVTDHDGRLPKDWAEFCDWTNSHGSEGWKPEYLIRDYEILLPAQQTGDKVPTYILIKEKMMKPMERYLNGCVHFAPKKKELTMRSSESPTALDFCGSVAWNHASGAVMSHAGPREL